METINNDILSDGFRLEGSWASDLKDALKKMNESTTILEIDSSELIMYSIIDMQEDNFILARLCPDEINNEMFFPTTRQKEYLKREGNYGELPIKSLKNKGLTSELIRDIYENGFFFQIKVNKRCITLVPSKLFLSTLCNQMECGKMQIGRNIFRDLYLCSLLQNNGPFKIIYRTDNKYAGRLLGATSCRFLITPEDAVQSIWDELKKHDNDNFRIYFYSITHMKTVINFMKASEITICGHKFHFGCRFSFSDIARGSYSLESTIIYGGAIIPLDDVFLKKHVGKFLVKDFVEDYCKKNIINKVMNNLNRASKKKISSIKNTVTAFLKSAEFSKANGAKATKALMQDDDFFSSIPDQSGTEFDAIYCTGAVADYYLHQKTEIQYEVLCKCIGKVWKEGLKKYAK